MATTSAPAVRVHSTPDDQRHALAADVREGLTSTPKRLPPRWLYDQRGSRLFERITGLDEYYPTRAERAILAAHAREMAEMSRPATLTELGSGTSDKTRLLLDALVSEGSLRRFVAFDVAGPTITRALGQLALRYPGLELAGVVGDFERHLEHLPAGPGHLVALLGGTIGNLGREARAALLERLAQQLTRGDRLLLGADLVKDPRRLVAAYDDAGGADHSRTISAPARPATTADFEMNVLEVLNRELGAGFDPGDFDYVARWEEVESRVWMGLRARRAHGVRIAALDLTVRFEEAEELQTETSVKFDLEGLAAELLGAGLRVDKTWTDPAGDFAVLLGVRQ
ncbi:MAG: L-histidine N(alpha)-methyltransferase [Acidimicrobiales bacterium]